jgi:hypothetical protein
VRDAAKRLWAKVLCSLYDFADGRAGLQLCIAVAALFAQLLSSAAFAETATACTAIDLCYCINAENRGAIDANVARVRQLIGDQRNQGKAIGYMSIPLSTVGGSYLGVNQDVAQFTKDRIEKRLGANAAWILNPAAEGNLPSGASGADYMYMWTKILESVRGLGEDFDFVYFVGSSDFRKFFDLQGQGDMEAIDAYFDKRLAQRPTKKRRRSKQVKQASFPKLLRAARVGRVQLWLARRVEYRPDYQ